MPPHDEGEDRELYRRLADVERQLAVLQETWKNAAETWRSSWSDRISGGASREIARLSRDLERLDNRHIADVEMLRKDFRDLQIKTTRWEGAGNLMYIVAIASGLISAGAAWLLNKFGVRQ